MKGAFYYHVDPDGQTIRIRLEPESRDQKIKVRVMREWVKALLIATGFLALMVLGGTMDAWANTQVDSTLQATNH